jgi:hypothetical protein
MELAVRSELRPPYLALHYALCNATDETVFLLNVVNDAFGVKAEPKDDGTYARRADAAQAFDPTLSYANLVGDDVALLYTGVSPRIALRGVLHRPVWPLATVVGPRQRVEGVIEARMPLVEWHAHAGPTRRETRPVPVTRAVLHLEFVRQSAARVDGRHFLASSFFVVHGAVEAIEAECDLPAPVTLLYRNDGIIRKHRGPPAAG